jgi:hypothetical protein
MLLYRCSRRRVLRGYSTLEGAPSHELTNSSLPEKGHGSGIQDRAVTCTKEYSSKISQEMPDALVSEEAPDCTLSSPRHEAMELSKLEPMDGRQYVVVHSLVRESQDSCMDKTKYVFCMYSETSFSVDSSKLSFQDACPSPLVWFLGAQSLGNHMLVRSWTIPSCRPSEAQNIVNKDIVNTNETTGGRDGESVPGTDTQTQYPRNGMDTEPDPCRIDIDELKFGHRVGRGSYSTVYQGCYKETVVAIKVMHDATAVTHFQKEVAILKHLRHPNIIQYMGSCIDPPHLCIVSEFEPNGSLYKLLHKTATPLTLDNKIMIALGTALGMNYLHQRRTPIIHGDLKSANLLVRTDYHVRICDFGLSTTSDSRGLSEQGGTVEWAAPEVLNGSPSSLSSDVYSFGVVLWELFTGELPWSECKREYTFIAVGFRKESLPIPEDIPVWAQDLMGACFAEAESRPSFTQIIHRLKSI